MADNEKLVLMVTHGPEIPSFTAVCELLKTIREFGGKLLVCSPCLKNRGLTQDDLAEGAEIVAVGRFVAEVTSAANCLVC